MSMRPHPDPEPFSMPLPKALRTVVHLFQKAGHQVYVVGGAVRDHLLGISPGDFDLATDATPDQVMAIFHRTVPTGLTHGTVTVLLGGSQFEVTTLRTESGYSDGRHPDAVVYTDDIHADLARRDFTVNAMAHDPVAGVLHDPFGGRADLADRRIRAVGDPHRRFEEDGLRLLRAARFCAQLACTLDDATYTAMCAHGARLASASKERIRDELVKMLAAPRPSMGLIPANETGLMPFVHPDLAAAWAQDPSLAAATCAHVDALPQDLVLRLAALAHPCPNAADWLASLRFDKQTTQAVRAACAAYPIAYQEDWSDGELRRCAAALGLDTLLRVTALMCHAPDPRIAQAGAALRARIDRAHLESAPLRRTDLAVDGRALMEQLHLPAGKHIGRLLRALHAHVLEHPEDNTPQTLVALAARIHDGRPQCSK